MDTEEDMAFMRLALEEAKEALRKGEVPVGAVLVAPEGKVLARAHNLRETLKEPTAHAEILALREGAKRLGAWRLLGCTLYVSKEPCPMCAAAAVAARIKRLVFGCLDERAGGAVSLYRIPTDQRLNHRVELRAGLLAEESATLLREFFQGRR